MKNKIRVEKLEKRVNCNTDPVWIVVVYDGIKKPSEAEMRETKAKYRKEHPEERVINVIYVDSEEARENILSLLNDPLPVE